jgi:hypothetical protein
MPDAMQIAAEAIKAVKNSHQILFFERVFSCFLFNVTA